MQLKGNYDASGLAWGWGDPESDSNPSRWAFVSCGLHLQKKTKVRIKCYAPKPIVIWVKTHEAFLIKAQKVNDSYSLDFVAAAGAVEITTSAEPINEDDPRSLAFLVLELHLDGQAFDLTQPLLPNTVNKKDEEWFNLYSV